MLTSSPEIVSAKSYPTAWTRSSAWTRWRWPWRVAADQRSFIPTRVVNSPLPTSWAGCRQKTSRSAGLAEEGAATTSWSTHWNEGGLDANWQDINWVGLPEGLGGKQAWSSCSSPRRFFANGVESAADPGYRSNLGLQTRGRPRH